MTGMAEKRNPITGEPVALVHGVPVTERQARAVLLMLRDRLAGALPGYLDMSSAEQGQGWDDSVRLVEKCIDQHTLSIGDGLPLQERSESGR